MNLFRKKFIAFTMVFTLLIIAGGFCVTSFASASTISNNGSISQSGIFYHHNDSMSDHGSKKTGVGSCCVDSGSGHHVIDKSALSIKDKINLSTSAILASDTSLQPIRIIEDGLNVSSLSPPPKSDILSSVIKKE